MKRFLIFTMSVAFCATLIAQTKSAKRGVCWDEKTQSLSEQPVAKLSPGISWVYNWGVATNQEVSTVGPDRDLEFVPMCWNDAFDDSKLRAWLSSHPGARYLLGFNEPNLSWNVGGSQMTPQQAATAWPRVKQVAADYGLELVAPALNFSGDQVGDRVWEPFAWYDEFLRLLNEADIDPAIDYLAFHSYMNWYSAVNWVATEYFYTDKESSDLFSTANKGRYPNLVKYLEDYKEAHGHFPKMFLTEFCSYEGDKDGYVSSVDSQIDQMTQKVQNLEQSDLVAGYAWFMANMSQAPTVYPYNSLFMSNTATSELSDLGKVYVYMSAFDTEHWYNAAETVLAKDYVDASTDNQQAKVRPNSEDGSDIPLQVEWQSSAWTAYQITLPADGTYTLKLHMKSTADNDFRIYEDALGSSNRRLNTTLPSTGGVWKDVTTQVTLPAGQHTLLLYNMGTSSIFINSFSFESSTDGIKMIEERGDERARERECTYNIAGQKVSGSYKGIVIKGGKKFVQYIH